MPLLKNSLKNPSETKNYRAIAGSSLCLKLFDRVILTLWGHLLTSGSLQMGYKKQSSTAQCSYVMMETVTHFLNNGSHPIMVALDMTSAFDRCHFDVLFTKLEARLPPVILRALIFIYEKQFAWVRWGNKSKSETFKISNGTRQGSVLSPTLFSVYVQDLLDMLKNLGVGCHVGETFVGAIAWADDFLLLAPNRESMQQMLDLAAAFGLKNNLEFSCDPDPAKTKSKAIFMVGKKTGLPKPVNLQLYGKPLPWVAHATHLGHEFCEDGTMAMDARLKRGSFIGRSMEVCDAFAFAAPSQVLGAVKVYSADMYGAMLWRLDSEPAQKFTRCWNTCVKNVWGLSRATHTATVRWLASPHTSLREDLLARWVKFFQSLLSSSSPEVATIARVAAGDLRTTTGGNNYMITKLGLDANTATPAEVREKLRESEPEESEEDMARLGLLLELLEQRGASFYAGEEKDNDLNEIIDYLCTK